ncbi:hypothetical protein [Spiroplasma endosymbiont of Apeira syringaria]|uniref:hypothetical protein n=1 Tax=Spiroplasma endosymbiont of Apeira syringaria TaxID=3066307 RepID=UPI0030CADB86
MIIKYIDTYIEDSIPKIKAEIEKEWEESEDEDWDAVEAITTAFKSEFEKKDTEIKHLKKIIEEREEKIAQLETQLKNVLPKKIVQLWFLMI